MTIHGYKIGSVDKVFLISDFQSLVKVDINKDVPLPVDSRFRIASADLLGTKKIDVIPGKQKTGINYGDTLLFDRENNSADSLTVKVGNAIHQVLSPHENDSLLKEVKRLNDKVDALDKDLKSK